jgi:RimJ/RimL family protein N-acetyltransferase
MLEAYVSAADAFTSTADERASEPESWWVKRIADPKGLGVSFGAEVGGRLVGTVALKFSAKPKTRHSVLLIGMYVREEARGKGVGWALLGAALAHASQRSGVQIVTLTVTEGNAPAVRLYERAGFQAWGVEPMAIATPSGFRGKVHMSCTLPGRARRAVEVGRPVT